MIEIARFGVGSVVMLIIGLLVWFLSINPDAASLVGVLALTIVGVMLAAIVAYWIGCVLIPPKQGD